MKSSLKSASFRSSFGKVRTTNSTVPTDLISLNDIHTSNANHQDQIRIERIPSQRTRSRSFLSLTNVKKDNNQIETINLEQNPTDFHPDATLFNSNYPLYQTQYSHQTLSQSNIYRNKPFYSNSFGNNCDQSRCLQMLTCCCLISAASIAIAALIFALLASRTSLAEPTSTTTTSTTKTTTSTTSTTTTSTTSITTTSTTSKTTTSTSTTTTSTTSTSSTTRCSTTQMTTRVTLTPLPTQCVTYFNLSDGTRLATNSGGPSTCDQTLFVTSQWTRFVDGGGVSLSNCPIPTQRCGTDVTGWYSGVYPAIAGETTDGVVCYNWISNVCYWQNNINITNCNGFYVYYLSAPPICNARYCTM